MKQKTLNTTVSESKQEFTLTQDGETLRFYDNNEGSCMGDYESAKPKPGKDWNGDIIEDTETFFDWCKNSYDYEVVENESKHTPGPWNVEGLEIHSVAHWHICYMNPYAPEKYNFKSNARLIAAAPDMLEALKEAKTIIYNLMNDKEYRGGTEIQAIFDIVISKATNNQ